ncbi:PucR family transcriptional regulator [Sutcliffiella rhizosphaerae]|uniref:Leucine-rich protein n=1 Tax=Sutcliffiella rhizosphaerae TaxID=2880967 RepID=A0ABM8YRT4_9BACI|nr:helix-turn-helix domain-containing protein [Sutcliffiella rhizosphaerae]CAG9622572.1 Leucine-rich protein [Sutcliffiella rhizosphaerae]
MYNQLEKLFPNSLIKSTFPHHFSRYLWFLSASNEYVGIEKNAVNEKEMLLLETFLQKVEENTLSMTESEKNWFQFLYQGQIDPDFIKNLQKDQIRFIHFQFSEPTIHKEEWNEAISAFFEKPIDIVWENATAGVIIEYKDDHVQEEHIVFSDIADTTASDFYANLDFYIGSYSYVNERLTETYKWEKKCFYFSKKARKQRKVHSFADAIPYILTNKADDEMVKQTTLLFQALQDDQELLQSIKAYIENNLNVSLTSKKLFMHRNSLQYRMDKFIELTGMDIKNFQGAMSAYLAIIILESNHKK